MSTHFTCRVADWRRVGHLNDLFDMIDARIADALARERIALTQEGIAELRQWAWALSEDVKALCHRYFAELNERLEPFLRTKKHDEDPPSRH